MEEEKTLTAEKTKKPTLWDGALKMVKGETTNQLIEQFTAEMTLVAEGLCEDQTRLRKEVDGIAAQEDKRIQKLESSIDVLETSLEEERREQDKIVTELRSRISLLEKQAKTSAKDKKKSGGIIKGITLIVSIAAAAWVIVTVINVFFK